MSRHLSIYASLLVACASFGFSAKLHASSPDWSKISPIAENSEKMRDVTMPIIKSIKKYNDGKYLYLAIKGIPGYSRRDNVTIFDSGSKMKFQYAEYKCLINFEGEAFDSIPWVVTYTNNGPVCSQKNVECKSLGVHEGLELKIPLSILGHGKIGISVNMQTMFFVKDNMVGREFSSQLPHAEAIALDIPAVGKIPGMPEIKDFEVKAEKGVIDVSWKSDRKTSSVLSLVDKSGKVISTVTSRTKRRIQNASFADVSVGEYLFKLSVKDYSENESVYNSKPFKMLPAESGEKTAWLRVAGRYIVDDSGKPYKLVGMARCQYHTTHEVNCFGTLKQQMEHYRKLGMNSIRLAFAPNREEDPKGDYYKLGPDKFVEQYLAPEIKTIIDAGMYVIIDAHHIDSTIENMQRVIPIWEAIAKRYANEPRVAMYELWNESYLLPTGLSPESAPVLRKWFKECISAIRKHDKRHMILVSDWNAGWGAATESMWAPLEFKIDQPYNQVVFSKHMAKDHCNQKFFDHMDKLIADWNIPLYIGELELEDELQSADALRTLLNILSKDPNKYGVCFWRTHPDETIYANIWSPWAKLYASPVKGFK